MCFVSNDGLLANKGGQFLVSPGGQFTVSPDIWLASYVVHVRKTRWRAGADWMFGHLLDGDAASNHLSWQWVAGTFCAKPYLFNAENVAKFAPMLASPRTAIDTGYAALDEHARHGGDAGPEPGRHPGVVPPPALPEVEPCTSFSSWFGRIVRASPA
ncbi:MAG: hypothetical protein LDL16_06300, partial [Thiobacillus sp.]|nr:hypothetical protein [Thiobacillus sp.]